MQIKEQKLTLALPANNQAFSSGPDGGLEADQKHSRGGKWLGGPRDTHAHGVAVSALQLAGSSACDQPARLYKTGCEEPFLQGRLRCSETHCHPRPKILNRALFRARERKEYQKAADLQHQKKANSGGESQHTTRFPSAQEGELSHSQPLVTSVITASCLAFFPFQMLMQYLYYGGTESMEIPTADILEVRVFSSKSCQVHWGINRA